MNTKQPEALAQECADYATSLRSTINVVKLEGREPPTSFLRAAELFERAAARIAELEARMEVDARHPYDGIDCRDATIAELHAGYAAARLEIESLKERVQQLGQLARDVNSRRVTELEAQLAAVGAGGVEPLRKRCLHQISEPAKAGWCDGCSPDNCGGCVTPAAPAKAEREAFEGWVAASGRAHMLKRDDRNDWYADLTVTAWWTAWQASAARGAAQAAPVDATVQRDAAIEMLADWVHAVNTNGTGWDDWDEHFKDAAFRPGPLRKLLNKAIAARAAQKEAND